MQEKANGATTCFWCEKSASEHRDHFLCFVCYTRKDPGERRATECEPLNCEVCAACLRANITSQFTRLTDVNRIKCICQSGQIPEHVIKAAVEPKEYQRLLRLRLSRKIDGNKNMIWCPHLGCEQEIEKKRGDKQKIQCTYCQNFACFSCQKPWHEGRCRSEQSGAFRCFTLTKDVRRCPRCRVRIEKNEGCPHMSCSRCNFYFCWACMGELNDTHSTWYKICPELPFSLCANLIITFLFILFLPLIITLGPLLWIIGATAFYMPY